MVIIVTSFTCIHTGGVYLQYKGNICNRAFKCGSELPEYVALILRNGGSQSPDRWLREPQNNQLIFFSANRKHMSADIILIRDPSIVLVQTEYIPLKSIKDIAASGQG